MITTEGRVMQLLEAVTAGAALSGGKIAEILQVGTNEVETALDRLTHRRKLAITRPRPNGPKVYLKAEDAKR